MGRFVFWGLFVAAAIIVVGYTLWMVAAERADDGGLAEGGSAEGGSADRGSADRNSADGSEAP